MEGDWQRLPRGAARKFAHTACQAVSAAVLAATVALSGAGEAAEPGQFDYFVLSLSWSPTYCASAPEDDAGKQCEPGRRFAFVVHGLWPQYRRGWPENCETSELWLPEERIGAMLDIMPSRGLVIHQWRKHGTCSGLSQRAYFAATRALYRTIRIPARYQSPQAAIQTTPRQLVDDFITSNRGLTPAMVSVQCGNSRDRARLAELRICFGKTGSFAACGPNEAHQCHARQLVMPPVK